MTGDQQAAVNEGPLWLRVRRLLVILRTEGAGPMREGAAIAIGVFVGCLPLYGFHLLICGVVGTMLRLNRLKMYLAANISNPFIAPWLLLLEVHAGAWLRRGTFQPLSVEAVQQTSLATLGLDLIVGSVAVGAVLAGLAGWATYAFVRRSRHQDAYSELSRRAADRYIRAGVVAWEFARGKLRGDPIYRASVCDGLLTPPARSAPLAEATAPSRVGGTLLDVGCGQGLTLALLAEARRAYLAGAWPAGWPSPPQFDRLIGIETRGRVASVAAAALAGDADVITADARTTAPIRAKAILLFDVLHMMSLGEQESLLASMAATLEAGGVMLIREADAAAGWRFTAIKCGNRLKAVVYGAWTQSFHFRTAAEWRACLVRHGFDAEVRDMSTGTPFANVLLVATRRAS